MTNRAVAALTVTATAAGVLVGAALSDRLVNPNFPKTIIRLSPGDGGRCQATTDHYRLPARKQAHIQWRVIEEGCSLAAGGRVQLRFSVLPSPTAPAAPTQNGNVIHGRANDDAPNGVHAYKVYADFDTDAEDYVLQDPDLEIVTYGFFGALLHLLIPFW